MLLSTTPLEDLPGTAPAAGAAGGGGDDGELRIRTAGTDLDEQDAGRRVRLAAPQHPDRHDAHRRRRGRRGARGRPAALGGRRVLRARRGRGPLGRRHRRHGVPDQPLAAQAAPGRRRRPRPAWRAWCCWSRGERGSPTPEGADEAPAGTVRGPVRWLVDAGVVGALAVWSVIGPLTVDDGYIAGIIHGRDGNGYIGNVLPLAQRPRGALRVVLRGDGRLVAHQRLDRVDARAVDAARASPPGSSSRGGCSPGSAAPPASAGTVAGGLVFLVWWLPTNLGLRPEPWVAAGLAAVLVLVERGLRRERLFAARRRPRSSPARRWPSPRPGAVAFLPFLAAAVPVLRLARRTVGVPVATALAAAGVAAALLLMFADQSLGAVLRGERDPRGAARVGALVLRGGAAGSLLLSAGDLRVAGPARARAAHPRGGRRPRLAAAGGPVAGRADPRARRPADDGLRPVPAWSCCSPRPSGRCTSARWRRSAPRCIVLALGLWARRRRTGPPADVPRTAAAAAGYPSATAPGPRSGSPPSCCSPPGPTRAGTSGRSSPTPPSRGADIPPELCRRQVLHGVPRRCRRGRGRRRGPHRAARGSAGRPTSACPAAGWVPAPGRGRRSRRRPHRRRSSWAASPSPATPCATTYSLAGDAAATVSGDPCGLAEELTAEPDPSAGELDPSPATSEDDPEPVLDGFVEVADGDDARRAGAEHGGHVPRRLGRDRARLRRR